MPMRLTTRPAASRLPAATQRRRGESEHPSRRILLDAALAEEFYGAFTANMHPTRQDSRAPAHHLGPRAGFGGERPQCALANGRNGRRLRDLVERPTPPSRSSWRGSERFDGWCHSGERHARPRWARRQPVSFPGHRSRERYGFLARGAHTATYGATAAPAVTATRAAQTSDTTATLEITSTTAIRTEVAYGTEPTKLTGRVVDGTQGARRTVTLDGLKPGTTYYYQARVTGPTGRTDAPQSRLRPRRDRLAPTCPASRSTHVRPHLTVSWRPGEDTDGAR